MRRAWLAVLLLLAAPAAASPVCESSWQDAYAKDWGYSKERWLGDCRADIDPHAGLRRAQAESMDACRARFHQPDAGPAAPQADILCALGKPGRAKLFALAGLPDPDAAPVAASAAERARPSAPPAGAQTFGPLKRALGTAREKWKPDACFSGMHYLYSATPVTSDDEWRRAARAKEDPAYAMSFVEEFDYAFHSSEIQRGGYRVAYGDHVDTASCVDLRRDLGPDVNGFPHVPFFASCLSSVKLDVRQAMAAVHPDPFPVSTMKAALGTMSAEFLNGSGCSAILDPGVPGSPACRDAPGWDARSLRKTLGREVWALMVDGRTDFVDAATGERLGWAKGELYLRDFSEAGIYGRACPIPRITIAR